MKATESKLLEFLEKSPQFVIPIYQRTYSWSERECKQLWNDLIRTGKEDSISAHFMGSIVYIEKGLYHVSRQPPLLVIDGQQRLTTVMLILELLARCLEGKKPVQGFTTKDIRDHYTLDPRKEGESKFKLLLTQTDRESLLAQLQNKPLPTNHSIRIKDNFEYFQTRMDMLDGDLTDLCRGLLKMVIVDISLDSDQDNPQLIFESMNSTGRELTQADLIRNYVLMGLDLEVQNSLYEEHWRPMELDFGQEAYSSHFDDFMRHYLTVKSGGDVPKLNAVYEAFKVHAEKPDVKSAGVKALVADLQTYSTYYCRMALGKEQSNDLAIAFKDLRELKVDVSFPLLLELYRDYQQERLSLSEFVRAVRLIEAYVFRRAICSIPTNSLRMTFATFGRSLDKNDFVNSMKIHFLNLPSYRRFPNDDEFKKVLLERELYSFSRLSYMLRRLENHDSRERVSVDEFTIEHVLPQNENLSEEWQTALGQDWQRVQQRWVHTLGNLTLTGYNSEYSDRSFADKREMHRGFKDSPLRLNRWLKEQDTWNEITIQSRANQLAELAVRVWQEPVVDSDLLKSIHSKVETKTNYTLMDHSYLYPESPTRLMFDAFRKEVLSLDPCISEEILKHYIAFKAETNFVDVIPQKNRLLLTLNMRFHDLHDPKQLGKDITNLGRLGNGNVEVDFYDTESMPYVMGLVRQSFEKQMNEGALDS